MSKAVLGGGNVGNFNCQFWPFSKWESFLFKAISVKILGSGSVSTKEKSNNHPTGSWLHLTHWIYVRKLLLLANTHSMPACQLWDKYLLWRREKLIVLRGFQKIIHLKEVTFHYCTWTIPVLLKKKKEKKKLEKTFPCRRWMVRRKEWKTTFTTTASKWRNTKGMLNHHIRSPCRRLRKSRTPEGN